MAHSPRLKYVHTKFTFPHGSSPRKQKIMETCRKRVIDAIEIMAPA
jgi:hypothetical protein